MLPNKAEISLLSFQLPHLTRSIWVVFKLRIAVVFLRPKPSSSLGNPKTTPKTQWISLLLPTTTNSLQNGYPRSSKRRKEWDTRIRGEEWWQMLVRRQKLYLGETQVSSKNISIIRQGFSKIITRYGSRIILGKRVHMWPGSSYKWMHPSTYLFKNRQRRNFSWVRRVVSSRSWWHNKLPSLKVQVPQITKLACRIQ